MNVNVTWKYLNWNQYIGLEKFKSTHWVYVRVWCDISCYKTVRKHFFAVLFWGGKGNCMCEYNEPLVWMLYIICDEGWQVPKLYSVNKWIQDLYMYGCMYVHGWDFRLKRMDWLLCVDIRSVFELKFFFRMLFGCTHSNKKMFFWFESNGADFLWLSYKTEYFMRTTAL